MNMLKEDPSDLVLKEHNKRISVEGNERIAKSVNKHIEHSRKRHKLFLNYFLSLFTAIMHVKEVEEVNDDEWNEED